MSEQQSFNLTLSRWHKVVERLVHASVEANKKAQKVLEGTYIEGYYGQEATLTKMASDARESISLHFQLTQTISHIKQKTQAKNAKIGVADLLLAQDAKQKQLAVLTSILNVDRTNHVAIDGLQKYFEANAELLASKKTGYMHQERQGVAVATLSAEAQNEYAALAQGLKRDINAIGDSISDLNQQKLSLELPVAIATLIGLI